MDARSPTIDELVEMNLRKPAASNPAKTIAQVIVDGSYQPNDLNLIADAVAFPTNKAPGTKNPYTSEEAIAKFAAVITPYLSNAELFALTDKLFARETNLSQAAFRNSSLVRPVLDIEIQRCSPNTPAGQLPTVLVYHFNKYIIPLIEEQWPGQIDKNIVEFLNFNLGFLGLRASAEEKLDQVKAFKIDTFNADSLNKVAPKVAEIDEFLSQYSLAPAVRKISEPKISTPTLARKETTDASRVEGLTKQLEALRDELSKLTTMKEAYNAAVVKSTQARDSRSSQDMRKQIDALEKRESVLKETITQVNTAINAHAPARPPKPPRVDKSKTSRGGVFGGKQTAPDSSGTQKFTPKGPGKSGDKG